MKKKMARGQSVVLILVLSIAMLMLGLINPVEAALVDNGDGTVTDSDMGLMWLQEPPPDDVYPGPGRMTWDEAMAWADALVFADYDDWRLPSAEHFDTGLPDTGFSSINNEWGHLYGVEWDNPASQSDILPMTGYSQGWYWTSTEDPGDSSKAYAFDVSYDDRWYNDVVLKSDWSVFVTAVRDTAPQVRARVVFEEAHLARFTIGSNTAAEGTGGYAEFASFLTANGYAVSTIDPGTTIDSTVLAPVDVLVVVAPVNTYSVSELDAIETWVNEGGRLLIISEWGIYAGEATTIAARFGITQPADAILDSDENAGYSSFPYFDGANLMVHPVTAGVTRVEMYGGNGITNAPADAIPLIVTDSDGTATWYNTGAPALGVPLMCAIDQGTAGFGRLIVITDCNVWDSAYDADEDGDIDFYDSDHETLALNTIDWLARAQFDWDHYHRYAEIVEGLQNLVSSGIAAVETIGETNHTIEIKAIKISDNAHLDEADEPDILFVGLHHGSEWISAEVPYYLAVNLVQRYDTDSTVKALVDSCEIWVVPVLNPDGFWWSHEYDRYWRKNTRPVDDTYGVDLNRNYGFQWGRDLDPNVITDGSPNPEDDTYWGPDSFSEAETRAIRDLLTDPQHNFEAVLSYHSFRQLILYPWAYTEDPAPDSGLMSTLATEMADLIYSVHGETYTPMQASGLYLISGDLSDWVYSTMGIPAFTIELRPESADPWWEGFLLPEDEILDTCEENWPAALFLISYVAQMRTCLVVRGQDNQIYYRTYDSASGSWDSWIGLPGATVDSPAAAVYENQLHIVVRGADGSSLWHGYVDLSTGGFSSWTRLSGSTPSAPTLTSDGSKLCLAVRGSENQIWYRCYTDSWGDWHSVPTGLTCDTPAAALLGGNLHIVVRGMDEYSLWHIIVTCEGGVVRNWVAVSGSTFSRPTLTASQLSNRLHFVVRGMDNGIYCREYDGSGDSWGAWSTMPGATCDGAGAATLDVLHIAVRGMDENSLWHWNGSSWTSISGSTPSAPTLTN